MTEKHTRMIRIKWVRSGIGFTRHQKTIVRSLGLSKLNHTVVRPDTPQIRGIVASVPHLLEIVAEPTASAWASTPEYTVHAPVAAPTPPVESLPAETKETEAVAAQGEIPQPPSTNPGEEKEPSLEQSAPAGASEE